MTETTTDKAPIDLSDAKVEDVAEPKTMQVNKFELEVGTGLWAACMMIDKRCKVSHRSLGKNGYYQVRGGVLFVGQDGGEKNLGEFNIMGCNAINGWEIEPPKVPMGVAIERKHVFRDKNGIIWNPTDFEIKNVNGEGKMSFPEFQRRRNETVEILPDSFAARF